MNVELYEIFGTSCTELAWNKSQWVRIETISVTLKNKRLQQTWLPQALWLCSGRGRTTWYEICAHCSVFHWICFETRGLCSFGGTLTRRPGPPQRNTKPYSRGLNLTTSWLGFGSAKHFRFTSRKLVRASPVLKIEMIWSSSSSSSWATSSGFCRHSLPGFPTWSHDRHVRFQ